MYKRQTIDEAKAALTPVVQAAQSVNELQLTYNQQLYSIDLNQLRSSHNLDDVLLEAYGLGKSGDYETMKAVADDVKANGRSFSVNASYDATALSAQVAQLAVQIDTPPVDASVASVNTEERTIEFNDAIIGVTVQQDALLKAITDALNSGQTAPVEIPVLETQPVITKEDLAARYVKRASATTNFSDSTSDRKYNVRKGAGMINGTVLKPGEVFSTNDALGTRTTSNGWKTANAYESGAVVPQAGGGVCQLSSTLYNAAVKADLEIVFRRNHSMPVSYVDRGLDATINSVGNIIDFKFKNNTDSDIVIFGYTTNNKTLSFEIWGVPFATDEYDEIKLSSEMTSKNSPSGDPVELEMPEGTEKPDGTLLAAGERYTAVSPRTGYQYQSYKNYYKNGVLVRSEKLATSTYKSYVGEIWVAPTPTPDPNMTPEPTLTPEPAIDPAYPAITPDPYYPLPSDDVQNDLSGPVV